MLIIECPQDVERTKPLSDSDGSTASENKDAFRTSVRSENVFHQQELLTLIFDRIELKLKVLL